MSDSDDGQFELFGIAEITAARPKRPPAKRRRRLAIRTTASVHAAYGSPNVIAFPTARAIFGDVALIIEVAKAMAAFGGCVEPARPTFDRYAAELRARAARIGMDVAVVNEAGSQFFGCVGETIRAIQARQRR